MNSKTNIPSFTELLYFSIPQLALMLCHICISLTDLWVAGKLGESVQAGLGIVTQFYMVIILVVSFAGTGFSSAIAQSLGAQKSLRASRYVFSMLCICFSMGIIVASIAILGILYAPIPNIEDPELIPIVRTFIIAYCFNLPFYYLMIMINGVFRAYKQTKIPCRTLFIVCTINFIASLGFGTGMFGFPNFSYAGVAWATTLSGIVGCLVNIFALWRSKILTKKSIPSLAWNKKALPYVFRIGIPAALSSLISQSGSVLVMVIILSFPGDTSGLIAGMTLGVRVQAIILFIVSAIAISIGILVAHLMGARDYEGIYSFGQRSLGISFLLTAFLSLILYLLREPITMFMSTDNNVVYEAIYYLNFACLMLPFMSVNAILSGVFSGVGANKLNALVNVTTTWFLNIPCAYFFGVVMQYGIFAVYFVSLLSSVISACLLLILFYKRTWQNFGLIRRTTPT